MHLEPCGFGRSAEEEKTNHAMRSSVRQLGARSHTRDTGPLSTSLPFGNSTETQT
jgi:hypothetical protein